MMPRRYDMQPVSDTESAAVATVLERRAAGHWVGPYPKGLQDGEWDDWEHARSLADAAWSDYRIGADQKLNAAITACAKGWVLPDEFRAISDRWLIENVPMLGRKTVTMVRVLLPQSVSLDGLEMMSRQQLIEEIRRLREGITTDG